MANQLGRRVRTLRLRARLSATALAGDALSVATISRIEHGGIEPSLGTLRYLAARLACPVADLLAEDDDTAALQAALEEVEAWFLLGRPDVALERASAALQAYAVPADAVPTADVAPRRRLHGAALRARALLDAAGAPALDGAIDQARRGGDIWLAVQISAVRALSLELDASLVLLQTALRLLPPPNRDTVVNQLCRGNLSFLLAQRFEAAGEVETAHGLFMTAAALGEPFRQTAAWAQAFLSAHKRAEGRLLGLTPPNGAGSFRPGTMISPGFALAAQVAGARLWRQASVDLARLELQSRRLPDAARRLRSVYATGWQPAELAVLGGFWSELDHYLDARRTAGTSLTDIARRFTPGDLPPQVADELVRLETAAQVGRTAEAEQIGAVIAVSLADAEAPLAQAIWLRLALAWAEAGNAPRAARALRAARQAGE